MAKKNIIKTIRYVEAGDLDISVANYNPLMFLLKNFIILLLLLWTAGIARAATVSLSWDPNPDPDIAYYVVYWGTSSGTYTNSSVVVGTSYDVTGLTEGQTYYFAVRAVDEAGQLGELSDELMLTISGDTATSFIAWASSQDWIEIGKVEIDHEWKTVTLSKTFTNPVVIAGPPTKNGIQPCVIRIRNVTATSFEIRIQEWLYLDGFHVTETVPYVVIEAGTHMLSDGTLVEAGLYELEGTLAWKRVDFSSSFSDTPIVLQTIQTFNGDQTVTIRQRNIDAVGFESAMQEEQRLNDGHLPEIIGYLAVEPDTLDVKVARIFCDDSFKPVDADSIYEIQVEEEASLDSETMHVQEEIGTVLIGDYVFAQMQTFNGPDTAALRLKAGTSSETGDTSLVNDTGWYENEEWLEVGSVAINHEWKLVTLTKNFQDPVVIIGPPSFNGIQPCVVRVRNVTSNSFEVRIQEWMYLDGFHVVEEVPYMVIESGVHQLADGSVWEAGTYELSGTLEWHYHEFSHQFLANPLLLQTVQTFNGDQTVTVRQRAVTVSGFESALQEEESLNDGHLPERVGYLAIDHLTRDAFLKEVACNCEFMEIDPLINVQLRLEEEQSRDSEVEHVSEEVGVIILGNKVFAQIQTFNGGDPAALRRR